MFKIRWSNSDNKISNSKNLYFNSPDREVIIVTKPKESYHDKNSKKKDNDEANTDKQKKFIFRSSKFTDAPTSSNNIS